MKNTILKVLEAAEDAQKRLVFDLECELYALKNMLEGVGTELNHPSDFALGRTYGYVRLLADQVGISATMFGWAFPDSGKVDVKAAFKVVNKMLADLEEYK